jgi:hypothetical protein
MFRRAYRTRLDRFLAAIEIPALGLWLGALGCFAFISAPAAARIVENVNEFAALTSVSLGILADVGYVCGGLAVAAALIRSRDAADRTNDIVRAALVIVALGLVAYESIAIVPELRAVVDVHGEAFRALHTRSSVVYSAVMLLGLTALVMAAVRTDPT